MTVALAFSWLASATTTVHAAEFELKESEEAVVVTVDGKPFTTYRTNSGSKPILWPIYGPTGVQMTRAFPMSDAQPGEKTDHRHHRSFWFTHGDVNGIDYWLEPSDDRPRRKLGTIRHVDFLNVSSKPPEIVAENHWLDGDDEPVLTDIRKITFGSAKSRRWIDFDITLTADHEQEVKFGDTKEGTFGIRVAGWMKSEANGKIVNNQGATNGDAWGARAAWVDYHGPVNGSGETVGIAIMNHPSSFRFPCYWHVRTYGLFAANVFGVHNFENDDGRDGSHVLKSGERINFCYRVMMHRGDEQQGGVPEAFVDYAKLEKGPYLKKEPESLENLKSIEELSDVPEIIRDETKKVGTVTPASATLPAE